MKYTFTGKNLVVSQGMKDRMEQKMDRLERLFPENAEIFVAFSIVRQGNKIEVTVPLHNKRILRAEVTSSDMFTAIDEAVDILDRQMVKYKKRLKDKSRRDGSFKEELRMFAPPEEKEETEMPFEDDTIIIEKSKHFPLKPMDPEEAVMEMEMLGHSFFVFRHSGNDEINVVYKRHNGTYGLIDPNDPVDE
ncbi:MAG: ribosome-associated translation inhibitor RaiA [Defluviitaleaceae bacterium]|nr:ribosome-associated translation inhibitor RaiA [Defluviitaleaceae bacterium]